MRRAWRDSVAKSTTAGGELEILRSIDVKNKLADSRTFAWEWVNAERRRGMLSGTGREGTKSIALPPTEKFIFLSSRIGTGTGANLVAREVRATRTPSEVFQSVDDKKVEIRCCMYIFTRDGSKKIGVVKKAAEARATDFLLSDHTSEMPRRKSCRIEE